MTMPTVYLGLGSNLGDRARMICRALEELNKYGIKVERMSSVIETEPVGGPTQGNFLNAVARCETTLTPTQLLSSLKTIERLLGRVKTVTDGPREIDLDILLYDRLTISSPELTIPHPRMHRRDFVMRPLREIAPDIAEEIKPCAS